MGAREAEEGMGKGKIHVSTRRGPIGALRCVLSEDETRGPQGRERLLVETIRCNNLF